MVLYSVVSYIKQLKRLTGKVFQGKQEFAGRPVTNGLFRCINSSYSNNNTASIEVIQRGELSFCAGQKEV